MSGVFAKVLKLSFEVSECKPLMFGASLIATYTIPNLIFETFRVSVPMWYILNQEVFVSFIVGMCMVGILGHGITLHNRPIPVYRFPRRALTLCPQLCMGIQPGARFPGRSADALPATLYGHFTLLYTEIGLLPVCDVH